MDLKLCLLTFLESQGAYSASGQVRLPGGNMADLAEFMRQNSFAQSEMENLVQEMRSAWQVGAFWLNQKWLAFYTELGHKELNRLRGTEVKPPSSRPPEAEVFWESLEQALRGRGHDMLAAQVRDLRDQAPVMALSRQILAGPPDS
ncbi:MAG: hypothetical protein LBJ14_01560 [Desulfarculales bacterium]|jgi:hypothetical protein|nr:hypothetical protein [Desulfarculales bacterium]